MASDAELIAQMQRIIERIETIRGVTSGLAVTAEESQGMADLASEGLGEISGRAVTIEQNTDDISLSLSGVESSIDEVQGELAELHESSMSASLAEAQGAMSAARDVAGETNAVMAGTISEIADVKAALATAYEKLSGLIGANARSKEKLRDDVRAFLGNAIEQIQTKISSMGM